MVSVCLQFGGVLASGSVLAGSWAPPSHGCARRPCIQPLPPALLLVQTPGLAIKDYWVRRQGSSCGRQAVLHAAVVAAAGAAAAAVAALPANLQQMVSKQPVTNAPLLPLRSFHQGVDADTVVFVADPNTGEGWGHCDRFPCPAVLLHLWLCGLLGCLPTMLPLTAKLTTKLSYPHTLMRHSRFAPRQHSELQRG